MELLYSIYVLKEPISDMVRYVGFTSNAEKRLKDHIAKKEKNIYKNDWISSLKSNNQKPYLEVIEDSLNLKEAYKKEIHYIKLFKSFGANLTNISLGGNACMLGLKHSLETKAKMSETRKGEANSFYGKIHTEETKKKISEQRRGQKAWNKGIPLSETHKLNLHRPHKKVIYLTRFPLKEIRQLYHEGLSQPKIAKMFSTDQGTISKIINKINYK